MSRERSWLLRSSCVSKPRSLSSGNGVSSGGKLNSRLDCTHFPLLFADDVGGHHSAAGADVGQFSKRKTRKRRTDFAVEQQRIEIDELFREFDSAIVRKRRESLAYGRHALLHEIIADG